MTAATAGRTTATVTAAAATRGRAATAAAAAGAAGLVWKEGTRRAIAYVEGRENAEQVLVITGRAGAAAAAEPAPAVAPKKRARPGAEPEVGLSRAAMAVYTDRRGKPFAWQIPFEIGHFERVAALIRGENGG